MALGAQLACIFTAMLSSANRFRTKQVRMADGDVHVITVDESVRSLTTMLGPPIQDGSALVARCEKMKDNSPPPSMQKKDKKTALLSMKLADPSDARLTALGRGWEGGGGYRSAV